jgi:hypothetical protein
MFIEGESEDSDADLEADLLDLSTQEQTISIICLHIKEMDWETMLDEINIKCSPTLYRRGCEISAPSPKVMRECKWKWASDSLAIEAKEWQKDKGFSSCENTYTLRDVDIQGSKHEVDFLRHFLQSRSKFTCCELVGDEGIE